MRGDLITDHLMKFGAHTRNELAMVLDHIKEGFTFVDIGAHIGTYAIPGAKKVGGRGKVLALEGSPKTFALLVKNVAANNLEEIIRPVCAVVAQNPPRGIRRVEMDGNSGGGFYSPDSTSQELCVDTRAVLCAEGFERPDFIKIDVEGMEFAVLQSIAPIIDECRPNLYIEISVTQLHRFGDCVTDIEYLLRSFGYVFYRNTGERNSANNRYVKTKLPSLEIGGNFYDLLALQD